MISISTIAKRAGELADLSMSELRMTWPYSSGAESPTAVLAASKGLSRGQMIIDILLDEYDDSDIHSHCGDEQY